MIANPIFGLGANPANQLKYVSIILRQIPADNRFVMENPVSQISQSIGCVADLLDGFLR